MIAILNATNAAGDMLDELSLVANKLPQSAITDGLMAIVRGAERSPTRRRDNQSNPDPRSRRIG